MVFFYRKINNKFMKYKFCLANDQPMTLEICLNQHKFEGTKFLECTILS
jgi:hypothetical protein